MEPSIWFQVETVASVPWGICKRLVASIRKAWRFSI